VKDSIVHTLNCALTRHYINKTTVSNCTSVFSYLRALECGTYHEIKLLSGHQGFLNLQINKCMRRITMLHHGIHKTRPTTIYITPFFDRHTLGK